MLLPIKSVPFDGLLYSNSDAPSNSLLLNLLVIVNTSPLPKQQHVVQALKQKSSPTLWALK